MLTILILHDTFAIFCRRVTAKSRRRKIIHREKHAEENFANEKRNFSHMYRDGRTKSESMYAWKILLDQGKTCGCVLRKISTRTIIGTGK